MTLPVVVGVDGSEPSLRAVDWACDEAALRGTSVRLVYASLWERYEGTSLAPGLGDPDEEVTAENVTAEDVVRAAERRAHDRQPDVKVTTDVLPEEPEYALVRESRSALAVVLGCRGRGGMTEALLGSVGVSVAGHAHCPVVVLRGGHDNRVRPGTRGPVVLGVGDRPAGSPAVRFATGEALLRGVPLEAVRAWRRPARTPAQERERQAAEVLHRALYDAPAALRVERRLPEAAARDALLAASRDAGLLVVGARRRPGHYGLQLGRVAHGVLHRAACPVAVVPEA
ncbi:universal stress protein [Streptomyces sp. LP11]|uniref:Universal stress protein n=1 Tax=Streptomyces pyxinicus TaxID=2970331 RepID=A0ABT2B3P4_9ACTN|nr:universal stress protein [Streptomyces sp. LP11]MCS0603112.1 universal stress protein [Streptomyces sp. LP11]